MWRGQGLWANDNRKCLPVLPGPSAPAFPSFRKLSLMPASPFPWESQVTLQLTMELYVCLNII